MIAHRFFNRLFAIAAVGLGLSGPAMSQSAFSPAVVVNDKVVTYFEIEQRALLLELINAPGDARDLAFEQLVDERLQLGAAQNLGIRPNEEGVQAGMAQFASSGNLSKEDMLAALSKEGIAEETLYEFIYARIAWQGVVQSRFGRSVQISEQDIDRAIASNTGAGGLNVLLSEIVIPVTPQTVDQVMALANQLSDIRSQTEFESAARQYSQAATKDNGGKLDWLSITKLPPQIRPAITALGPNEVTAPVPLPNAVALFQMRRKAEAATPAPSYSAIDYAVLQLPGGRTGETLALAQEIYSRIDTCDDLFGEARAFPPEYMSRQTVPPSEIANDVAIELAKLDDNEVSTNLTRTTTTGQPLLMMVMLCGRTAQLDEELSREEVAGILRGQRLESFARSYLEQLRADATIVVK